MDENVPMVFHGENLSSLSRELSARMSRWLRVSFHLNLLSISFSRWALDTYSGLEQPPWNLPASIIASENYVLWRMLLDFALSVCMFFDDGFDVCIDETVVITII